MPNTYVLDSIAALQGDTTRLEAPNTFSCPLYLPRPLNETIPADLARSQEILRGIRPAPPTFPGTSSQSGEVGKIDY
ncbi:uncharacterized protein QC761_0006710 [Podospora bellae-mahoneyi]|uniref:Uncharacterized protein n=1 Tax=Podospora bellae-mahoneyi TaxID=2093777 RepID=A0ABR0FVL1_9PEZI|nr:hypothetical protein QC761_0006710 [Podospora bellae-mahoneyi]